MDFKKRIISVFSAIALLIVFGISPVSANSEDTYELEVTQELVDKAESIGTEIDQYVIINDEGLLEIDPIVEEIYGEELYVFFVYGAEINNEKILDNELQVTDSGISSTEQSQDGVTTFSGGCSWSNFSKSIIGGSISGATGGAVVGGLPGAGLGAIGGYAGGGLTHFATCWW
ncbi:hypothetical protein [Oceanobacillus oncorhynchi]|uniref:hypothetical protein n=1 Tax=Oceanobacillus oncorhynchi TaxID=545501 RepID=UPI0034D78F63